MRVEKGEGSRSVVRVSLRFGGETKAGREAGLWAGRLGRRMVHFVEEKW